MPPTRFIAFHEIAEDAADLPALSYAVMLARARRGVVLVQSRLRQVWELPGGAIDPGETPRQAAIRELVEESGCIARDARWLGVMEVHDGRTLFGACLYCEVDAVPPEFSNAETVSIGCWSQAGTPRPLGDADEAVLRRFA